MQKILQDNLNAESHFQYWRIGIYGLDIMRIFFILILLQRKAIFRNPCHCRYMELIISIYATLFHIYATLFHITLRKLFLEAAT